MSTAWRAVALRYRVTIKRNTTTTSASGASKFNYTVVLSNVLASLQDASGRMRQLDVGQDGGRMKSMLFGTEMFGQLQQNDLVVVGADTYKIVHLHEVKENEPRHVEALVVQWQPGGGT